jgi:hypothetical protein
MSPLRVQYPSEYNSWVSMRNRCLSTRCKAYYLYGGRGITIDPNWDKFENFLADMGPKPSKELSLDRENCDGNYCKSNCKWATKLEQSQNRRNSARYGYLTVQEEAKERGIHRNAVRVKRLRDRIEAEKLNSMIFNRD